MATANGAKALGLPTGRLARGMPADLILVSVSDACNVPLHNATSNLIYACNGGTVETTICNGRILMLERGIPGEAEVLNGAAEAAFGLVKRAQSA